MTETLLQKIEEKMMMLLSEVEVLRKETLRLNQENNALKFEKENHSQKLQGLVSLLDSMNLVDTQSQKSGILVGEPVLMQG